MSWSVPVISPLAIVALLVDIVEASGEGLIDFGLIVLAGMVAPAHPAVFGLVAVAGLPFVVQALVVAFVHRDRVCVLEHATFLVASLRSQACC